MQCMVKQASAGYSPQRNPQKILFLISHRIVSFFIIRDTQNYIRTASEGIGLAELKKSDTTKDQVQWKLAGLHVDFLAVIEIDDQGALIAGIFQGICQALY